jgi:elongation factor G
MNEKVQQYRNILIEKVAESDDALIEKYLAGEAITNEEIKESV